MNKVRMEISVDDKLMEILEHEIDLNQKHATVKVLEFINRMVDILDNIDPTDVVAMKNT